MVKYTIHRIKFGILKIEIILNLFLYSNIEKCRKSCIDMEMCYNLRNYGGYYG